MHPIRSAAGAGVPLLKRLALLLSTSTLLMAYTYHDTILHIYAKVLPKVLIINQPKEIPLDELDICIVHDAGDFHDVRLLEKAIDKLYGDGISGTAVNTHTTEYQSLASCQNATALMLMQSTPAQVHSAVEFARKNRIFTASYNASELSAGVIFSLDITSRVKPYLNVNAAKAAKVPLGSALMQISTIYREEAAP